MADDFRHICREGIGPGGINCPCCGPPPGKERKEMRRRARRKMKKQLREIRQQETIMSMIPHKSHREGEKITITVYNLFSGKEKSLELSCSAGQYYMGMELYKHGSLIQNAFPMLSCEEREFLMSGLLPEEFDAQFDDED